MGVLGLGLSITTLDHGVFSAVVKRLLSKTDTSSRAPTNLSSDFTLLNLRFLLSKIKIIITTLQGS